ncbi:hypothetical protein QR680_004150 [Steinernema hermaphroditum]|uniref:RING-type domain-containing protein n=1 Tax=Steinernema hermaphroditum TaxID=289476 RepID=A0AA39HQ25_9BILA|nr:hypothetical protein QR680_004150 [Steinernema hermaphroditum]
MSRNARRRVSPLEDNPESRQGLLTRLPSHLRRGRTYRPRMPTRSGAARRDPFIDFYAFSDDDMDLSGSSYRDRSEDRMIQDRSPNQQEAIQGLLELDSATRAIMADITFPVIEDRFDTPQNPMLDDDAFKCPICTEVYDQPKFLPCCRRSICEKCENRIVNNTPSSNCPMCNSPRQLTRRGPLGVNIDLRNAIEALIKNPNPNGLMHRTCQECERKVEPEDLCFCANCNREKKICWRCAGRSHKGHTIGEFKYMSVEKRKKHVDGLRKHFTKAQSEHDRVMSDCAHKAKESLDKAKEMYEEMLKNNFQTEEEFAEKVRRIEKIKQQVAKTIQAVKNAVNDDEDQ